MIGPTIYALSSGRPPAGIAVIRVSGPDAFAVAKVISGALPEPRRAVLREFRHPESGERLDRGLLVLLDGPGTATGEDIAEFHCHGGRATIDAMLAALAVHLGLRLAEAGEFTRRALSNGIIDLTEAEGLADLLEAETELQRRSALRRAEGATRRAVESLREELLSLSAMVELAIDYADEEDGEAMSLPREQMATHRARILDFLEAPAIDRLRTGIRVVIAGPPNSGKSSLINALSGMDRAIVTDIAGTTRDVIEVPLAIDGVPYVLVDTAGLRNSPDVVEQIGVDRAKSAIADADLVLWLGMPEDRPKGAILIASKSDLGHSIEGIPVSTVTGAGLGEVRALLITRASDILPSPEGPQLTERERSLLSVWAEDVREAEGSVAPEIAANFLLSARGAAERITGRAGVEDLLDSLFSRFCVGK